MQHGTEKAVTLPGIEKKEKGEEMDEDCALIESMKRLFDAGELCKRKEFREKNLMYEWGKIKKI